MFDYIKSLPKGELHVHLNGAIPSEIIKKMLLDDKVEIPNGFDINKDLNVLDKKINLKQYLKPWEVLNRVPNSKKDLKQQVLYATQALMSENVKFAEFRNTIFYIAELNKICLGTALEWLLEALQEAEEATGIQLGLIVTLNRFDLTLEKGLAVFNAMKNINFHEKLVGVDLAGDENIIVDNDISLFFEKSKNELNLGVTIHAGETGNLENVKQAINIFKADRLGHANSIVSSEQLMSEVAKRNIVIEVCPVSNYLTNAIKEDNYSFLDFLMKNVPFILCSDNPQIHKKSISEDYLKFYEITKRLDVLEGLFENQKKYTFIRGM